MVNRKHKVRQHCICNNCEYSDMYFTCVICGVGIPYCKVDNKQLICNRCKNNESLCRFNKQLQEISSDNRYLSYVSNSYKGNFDSRLI